MLRQRVHALARRVARVSIAGRCPLDCPSLQPRDHSNTSPSAIQRSTPVPNSGVAHGEELRAVIGNAAADAPRRHPPAHAAPFVDQQHALARVRQHSALPSSPPCQRRQSDYVCFKFLTVIQCPPN